MDTQQIAKAGKKAVSVCKKAKSEFKKSKNVSTAMKIPNVLMLASFLILGLATADQLVVSKRIEPIEPPEPPTRYFFYAYTTGMGQTGMITISQKGAPNLYEIATAIRMKNHLSNAVKIVITSIYEFPDKADFEEWLREEK